MNTIIAGFSDNKPYICSVDLYGAKMENDYAIQGFASYFCNPVITNYWRPDMDE